MTDTNHLHEYKAVFEQPETNMLWNQQNQISHSNIKRNEPRILQWAIIWQLVSHSQAFCHWQHKPMADEAKSTWRSLYPTLVVEPFLQKIHRYFGLYWHSVNSDFKNQKIIKITKTKGNRKNDEEWNSKYKKNHSKLITPPLHSEWLVHNSVTLFF